MCELFNEQCSSNTRKNISEESLRHIFSKKSESSYFLPKKITCHEDGLQSLELFAAIGSAGQLVALALDLINLLASTHLNLKQACGSRFRDLESGIQFPGSRVQDPGFNFE